MKVSVGHGLSGAEKRLEERGISRRDFMKFCGTIAAAMGMGPAFAPKIAAALTSDKRPSVIWLHGSSCTGCSVSFLNRIAATAPTTVADVLTGAINLVFHATLMTPAGDAAVSELKRVYDSGNYVLVLEGGVPTAFQGGPCVVYSLNGQETTYMQAVQEMSARAEADMVMAVDRIGRWLKGLG